MNNAILTVKQARAFFAGERLVPSEYVKTASPVIREYIERSSVIVGYQDAPKRVIPRSVYISSTLANAVISALVNPKNSKVIDSKVRTKVINGKVTTMSGNGARGATLAKYEPKNFKDNTGEIYGQALTLNDQRDILGATFERLATFGVFEDQTIMHGPPIGGQLDSPRYIPENHAIYTGDETYQETGGRGLVRGELPIFAACRKAINWQRRTKGQCDPLPETLEGLEDIMSANEGESVSGILARKARLQACLDANFQADKKREIPSSRRWKANYKKFSALLEYATSQALGLGEGWTDTELPFDLSCKVRRSEALKAFKEYIRIGEIELAKA